MMSKFERSQRPDAIEQQHTFEQLWDTLDALLDKHSKVRSADGSRQTSIKTLFSRPDGVWADRNNEKTVVTHEILLIAGRQEQQRTISVHSLTQWPWGHPNTGAKLGLGGVPLDKTSKSFQAVASIHHRPEQFPLEGFVLNESKKGLSVETHGAHGQFDFRVSKDSRIAGERGIHLSNRRILALDENVADDLEQQLLEGCLHILAELLEERVTVDEIPDLEALRQRVRARLASSVPEGFQGGENLETGESILDRQWEGLGF